MDTLSQKSIALLNKYGVLSLSNKNLPIEDVKKIISFLPTKKLLNTIVFQTGESYIILDVSRLSDIEFITWKTGRSDLSLKFTPVLDNFNKLYLHHVTGITPERIKSILERLGRYDLLLKIS
jgi:hypothetical protein